jgi:hypothetical protein
VAHNDLRSDRRPPVGQHTGELEERLAFRQPPVLEAHRHDQRMLARARRGGNRRAQNEVGGAPLTHAPQPTREPIPRP